jgi:hypothetical protein
MLVMKTIHFQMVEQIKFVDCCFYVQVQHETHRVWSPQKTSVLFYQSMCQKLRITDSHRLF